MGLDQNDNSLIFNYMNFQKAFIKIQVTDICVLISGSASTHHFESITQQHLWMVSVTHWWSTASEFYVLVTYESPKTFPSLSVFHPSLARQPAKHNANEQKQLFEKSQKIVRCHYVLLKQISK